MAQNSQAFPLHPDAHPDFDHGMTLRDYFAGQALAGMLPNDVAGAAPKDLLAKNAYQYADEMLAARETTGESE